MYSIGLLVSKIKDCWTTNASIPLFRRLCLVCLAPNFIQVMHDSTVSTSLLVILGRISTGTIMAHTKFDRLRGLIYVDDLIMQDSRGSLIMRNLNEVRGHNDFGAADWRRQIRACFNIGGHKYAGGSYSSAR